MWRRQAGSPWMRTMARPAAAVELSDTDPHGHFRPSFRILLFDEGQDQLNACRFQPDTRLALIVEWSAKCTDIQIHAFGLRVYIRDQAIILGSVPPSAGLPASA